MSLTAPSLPGPWRTGLRRRCDPHRPAALTRFPISLVSSRGRDPLRASCSGGRRPSAASERTSPYCWCDEPVRHVPSPSPRCGPSPSSGPAQAMRYWPMGSARMGASRGRRRRRRRCARPRPGCGGRCDGRGPRARAPCRCPGRRGDPPAGSHGSGPAEPGLGARRRARCPERSRIVAGWPGSMRRTNSAASAGYLA